MSSPRTRRRDDRGAGTVLIAVVIMALALATLGAAWMVGWVTSVHRADRLADLAALAGAEATSSGRDGCAAARQVAGRNGGRVDECELRGQVPSFVLVVKVSTPLRPEIRLPRAPRRALGSAAAGPGQP